MLWKEDKRQWVKPASYAVYLQLCNNYLLPVFGDKKAFDEALIQSQANSLLSQGYSIKTVKDTMLVLRMILRFGEKLKVWPHLEFSVHFPTRNNGPFPAQTLSIQQQRLLLDYLQGHFSFRNLGLRICLETGLRIGEICGLQWMDMDLESGAIHVRKTVQHIYLADGEKKDYFLSIGTPKTASSVRDIPMSSALKALLRPFKKVMDPAHYVLSNAESPITPKTYRNYFYKLLQSLGIPHVCFHALRHSFATRCIESKCDYKTVSAILGHASLSTTMDLYVHPDFSEKKKAIERMTRMVRV